MTTTSNVSHDVVLIHYGWEDFLPISSKMKDPRAINEGLTYASYSRTKNVGNILNLTFMGVLPDIFVGDWIVLKTSNSGKFNKEDQNDYLNKGLVKFIGQVYLITSQYNADADGLLKKSYNVNIREWSHCLNIPVRYSGEIRLLSSTLETQGSILKSEFSDEETESSETIQKFKDSDWDDLLITRESAFEKIRKLLFILGIRSSDILSSKKDQDKPIPLTTSRLPSIPSLIYKNHIQLPQEQSYEEQFPFSTGFLLSLIGTQQWQISNSFEDKNVFSPVDLDGIIDANKNRPPVFISPSIFSEGTPFPSLVRQILDTGGEYEVFTDLLYVETAGLTQVQPTLVIRDKPIAMKMLTKSDLFPEYEASEENFGFTYKDDLPRIDIPLSHVLSINLTYSSQESYNYIQFKPVSKVLAESLLVSAAYNSGRYKDSLSQKRFGGQEYVASISEFVADIPTDISEPVKPPKITEPKDKKGSNSKAGTESNITENSPISLKWFNALVQKYKYYMPSKILMPNCTIQIIDNDFPLTVGLMVRIDLGPERLTICGEIEEISSTYSISGEGRVSNQTYIKMSDLLIENKDDSKVLNIIPKEFSQTLFIDINSFNSENEAFLKTKRGN